MHFFRSCPVSLLFSGMLLGGCQKESIHTYDVPKEAVAPLGAGAATPSVGTTPEITWSVPKGWQEAAPSSMRVGSFLIHGANGEIADMSVVPLSGEAGGDLENINRWRGQIQLRPLTRADLLAQSEWVSPAGRKMLYINFVSHELMIHGRFKKRLIAAIYHQQNRTWFFKLLGEDATVLSAKPAFLQFLRSLKFNEN